MNKRVIVKTNRQLENLEVYKEIQKQCQNYEISRREVPMAIHKAIFNFKGEITWPDGTRFIKPVCIFTEFDLENRWFSNFVLSDDFGNPVYPSSKFNRIRLLDIYNQITFG